MDEIIGQLLAYAPKNEQEEKDRTVMLAYIPGHPECLSRKDANAHFTASAWIVNRQRTKVCFVYHKLYQSWSWVGGHADGDADLAHVAVKEAMEETGLCVTLASSAPISVEILSVAGHVKKGQYVSSHLHYNLTYLCYADENEALTVNPDENTDVRWFSFDDALKASAEPWMVENVYRKLMNKNA